MITLKQGTDIDSEAAVTWRLGIPDKSSLRLVPRYMEFARGPTFLKLYGELPPRLGCNPKRSNNRSPDRDIPQFTVPFYLLHTLHSWALLSLLC